MADLLFVVIVVAFFAIAVAYVRACDHLIGPDPDLTATSVGDPVAGAGDDSSSRDATLAPTAAVGAQTTPGAW